MERSVLLETRDLTKTFRGRKVVDRLNLRVERGDVYGFLGQNGSGKTTTIRMITGLIHPDGGDVSIGGYDLRRDFKKAIAQVGAMSHLPCAGRNWPRYNTASGMADTLPIARGNDARQRTGSSQARVGRAAEDD